MNDRGGWLKICSVDGCDRKHESKGYCRIHAQKARRGHPVGVDGRTTRTGALNVRWAGGSVGYGGAHDRVRNSRGPADSHACFCGAPADHWSYNHQDPAELTKIADGYHISYSADPEMYDPLCASCHRERDLFFAALRLEQINCAGCDAGFQPTSARKRFCPPCSTPSARTRRSYARRTIEG